MIIKDGHIIRDLETWRQIAGPKRAVQWQDHRSAKESAKAWVGAGPGSIPREIREALSNHGDFNSIGEGTAEPEAAVPFDSFSGEPPNLDWGNGEMVNTLPMRKA